MRVHLDPPASKRLLSLRPKLLPSAALGLLLAHGVQAFAATPPQTARLRITNGCDQPIWVFYQVGSGGGTLVAPNQRKLAKKGDFIDYAIPDAGLAGTRFWPGMGCDATGNNCRIGQSGGPGSEGFTCPANFGCAPPVDSKFEGTFGCLPSVTPANCQINPAKPSETLPQTDGWDTSMVDGFTLPYQVKVKGTCPGGPKNNAIDCSALALSLCPTREDLSTNGQYPALKSENLELVDPGAQKPVRPIGCYSPCSKLTDGQWQSVPNPPFSGTTYLPTDPQAKMYCCPGNRVDACRQGPVVSTGYVKLIHSKCPQTYAYAYDDLNGNFSCPAGTRYEVTFFCPASPAKPRKP